MNHVIVWVDGHQETYDGYDWAVNDGLLTLQPADSSHVVIIPLANIRTWTTTQRPVQPSL